MTKRNPAAFLIGTWFGCGYAPVGPGTAGSIAAVAIAIALHYVFHFQGEYERAVLLILTAILLAPGIWAAHIVAKQVDQTDPHIVVVDEVIGQWITLAGAATFNWTTWLVALVLFRLLDVWKPAPARQLEHLPGGWGIVADDVMAGIYGALAIFVLERFHLLSYGI